jgi:hypothetical protein
MGILDKAKEAASKAAAEVGKGAQQVQGKVEAAQTKRKADELAQKLGYLIVAERSGEPSAGDTTDELVAQIKELQAQLAQGQDSGEPAAPPAPSEPPEAQA